MSSGTGEAPGDFGKGPSQENFERMTSLARGPKGEAGTQGERGERGLSRIQGRGVVFLFGLAVVLAAYSLFWNAHEVNSNAAAQQRQQASQKLAAQLVEARLCKSLLPLEGLANLRPPAGDPVNNPSRAYEQELSAKLAPLAQLGPDLGCGGRR